MYHRATRASVGWLGAALAASVSLAPCVARAARVRVGPGETYRQLSAFRAARRSKSACG